MLGRERSVGDAEFGGNHQDLLQLLVLGEIAVQFFDDPLIQRLYVGRFHQLLARGELDAMVLRPLFQLGEIGHDEYGWKLALVAQQRRFAHQQVGLQRVLDRLRSDELAARSLDQVLLAVGDGEKTLLIESADVAGLEPAILERICCFFRHVPVAL